MTMADKEITLGAQFESFASFRDALSRYEKAKRVLFVRSSSKLLMRNSPIFTTLKYDFVMFECKQGERRPTKCTGIRPNQRTIKLGCPAKIRLVTRGRDGTWYLKITSCRLEHSNHPVAGDTDSKDNSQCFDGAEGEPGEDVDEGATISHDFKNHSSTYIYSAPSTSTETYPSSLHQHNYSILSNSSKKRKRKPDSTDPGEDKHIEDDILALVHKRLLQTPTHQQQSTGSDGTNANNDELVSFGRHVTNKLRNMSNEQRIFAEKLINDVLFEGALGSLSRSVSLIWNPNPVPIHMLPPM